MTDKVKHIEDMAKIALKNTLSYPCARQIAEKLYKEDYRKIPEGSVVLPKKLYEQYTDELNNYEVGKRDGSKETAREILDKVDNESNGQTKSITDLLRKQYGVEVEE